jgi:hypothetical protein
LLELEQLPRSEQLAALHKSVTETAAVGEQMWELRHLKERLSKVEFRTDSHTQTSARSEAVINELLKPWVQQLAVSNERLTASSIRVEHGLEQMTIALRESLAENRGRLDKHEQRLDDVEPIVASHVEQLAELTKITPSGLIPRVAALEIAARDKALTTNAVGDERRRLFTWGKGAFVVLVAVAGWVGTHIDDVINLFRSK